MEEPALHLGKVRGHVGVFRGEALVKGIHAHAVKGSKRDHVGSVDDSGK